MKRKTRDENATPEGRSSYFSHNKMEQFIDTYFKSPSDGRDVVSYRLAVLEEYIRQLRSNHLKHSKTYDPELEGPARNTVKSLYFPLKEIDMKTSSGELFFGFWVGMIYNMIHEEVGDNNEEPFNVTHDSCTIVPIDMGNGEQLELLRYGFQVVT